MTGYVNIPVEPREALTPIPLNRPQVLDFTYQSYLARGVVLERRLFQIMSASEDTREGTMTFAEKRFAVRTGR